MKSAYERAMEKLEQAAPIQKLTQDQLGRVREMDEKFTADIAEREVYLGSKIAEARTSGRFDEAETLQRQLAIEVRRLREDLEEKKEIIRNESAGG
jgi:hypothetical protein